jgi:hypothetical protein
MKYAGIFYNYLLYLVYFMVIWYILLSFGMFYDEKSGNPAGLANESRKESKEKFSRQN